MYCPAEFTSSGASTCLSNRVKRSDPKSMAALSFFKAGREISSGAQWCIVRNLLRGLHLSVAKPEVVDAVLELGSSDAPLLP